MSWRRRGYWLKVDGVVVCVLLWGLVVGLSMCRGKEVRDWKVFEVGWGEVRV